MTRHRGKLRGITRTASKVPPFERHYIRLGETALRDLFVPDSLCDFLESCQPGAALELAIGRLGPCQVVLRVRNGQDQVRASFRDFAWVALFACPVMVLASVALGVWTLSLLSPVRGPVFELSLAGMIVCFVGFGLVQLLRNAQLWMKPVQTSGAAQNP
jgi:hypothetical protein